MSLILEALARQTPSASSGLRQAAPGQLRGSAPAKQGWSIFYILLSVAVLAGVATTLGWLISQHDGPTGTQAPIPAPDVPVLPVSWPEPETPAPTPIQTQAYAHALMNGRPAPQDARAPADAPAPLLKMARHIQEQDALIRKLEARLSAIAESVPMPNPSMPAAALAGLPGSLSGTGNTAFHRHEGATPLYDAPRDAPSLPQGSFVVQADASKTQDAATDTQNHERRIADRIQIFEAAMANGDWSAAERHLNDLSSLLPADSLTLLRNKAWLLMNKGSDAESRKLYTRILERLPADLNAQLNLAILEQRVGDRRAAAERLQRILDDNPGQPDALAALDYLQALP